MKTILDAKNISKVFRDGKLETPVLHEISLTIAPKERVAIIGSSGSGKSTLLHILGGLEVPSTGEVTLAEHPFTTESDNQRGAMRNASLGFVYQFHHLLPEFSALENVAMPLLIRGQSRAQARAAATEILTKVGLDHRLLQKPATLSGGERQRAAIARALVTNPLCVLADEPTGNLDRRTADSVYQLMLEMNQAIGTSFVVVTHDEALAQTMDRVLRLEDGQLKG